MTRPSNYLATLAQNVAKKYYGHLGDLCLIFPSTQVVQQFRYHLGKVLAKPTWSPDTYLLPAFMQEIYSVPVPKVMTLLGHLYQVSRKTTKQQSSFLQFMPWGQQFLGFLEDVAQYLVSMPQFFSRKVLAKSSLDQTSKKQVGDFWETLQEPQGLQKGFVANWVSSEEIYKAFRGHLAKKGIAYQGMHYEQVLQRLVANEVMLRYKHIIAIGLHPITPLAKKIFEALQCHATLDFYYDTDDYYMGRPGQEAGHYLRQYAKDPLLGKNLQGPYKKGIEAGDRSIYYMASNTQVGQAEIVGRILKKLMREDRAFSAEKAAIVLSDSQLLIPLLHVLPSDLPLNISVQYPFSHTPLYELIVQLLTLHCHWQSYRVTGRSLVVTTLQVLISHPYIRLSREMAERLLATCRKDLNSLKKVDFLPVLWKHLLASPSDNKDLWSYILKFLALLSQEKKAGSPWASWEEAGLQKVTKVCQALQGIPFQQSPQQINAETLHFFQKVLQSLSFSIQEHNPNGIKIVHAKNALYINAPYLFMLSMNEGSFPVAEKKSLLVPPALCEAYGLPGSQEQNASYGYLFYSLLQQAKHFFCIYHAGKTMGASSEISRYLLQVRYETDFPILEQKANSNFTPFQKVPIQIRKEESILLSLKDFVGKNSLRSLTPTAINMYLDCSLRFYFQYLAKLKAPEPSTPMLPPALFGQLFHKMMELLYRDYVGEEVTQETLQKILKKVPQTIHQVLKAQALEVSSLHGGTIGFIAKLLEKLVKKVIQIDHAEAPFILRGVEVGQYPKLKTILPLADGRLVNFGGIIDRIDQKADKVRIIDYKTSLWDPKITAISELFDSSKPMRNKIALQVMWYSWLYEKQQQTVAHQFQPAVMSTRNLLQPSPDFRLFVSEGGNYAPINNSKAYQSHFESGLQKVVEEIYDPEKNFEQTSEAIHCRGCPYHDICH